MRVGTKVGGIFEKSHGIGGEKARGKEWQRSIKRNQLEDRKGRRREERRGN